MLHDGASALLEEAGAASVVVALGAYVAIRRSRFCYKSPDYILLSMISNLLGFYSFYSTLDKRYIRVQGTTYVQQVAFLLSSTLCEFQVDYKPQPSTYDLKGCHFCLEDV